MSDAPHILGIAQEWAHSGHAVAIGTVVKTWGSAPRPAGSVIAIRDDGAFEGSVSGGCVEGEVIARAQETIASGRSQRLEFGIADELAWSVGLACGGKIEIYLEALGGQFSHDGLATIMTAYGKSQAVVRAVTLHGIQEKLVIPGAATDALGEVALRAARSDHCEIVEIDGEDWFVAIFNPQLDLVIVGAAHIAQPLARMAELCDYRVRIIDPRTAFATSDRFPRVAISHDWPDEALAKAPLSARSALVALTHDPKIDDPALRVALASPCFYVGALGSRKTHANRLARLAAHGIESAALARIKGPIGLAIGAASPAEIAVAILAQITQELRLAAQPVRLPT
jgi:xanthine dehydrogenase accessory factor